MGSFLSSSQSDRGERMDMFASNLRRERWAISRMDLSRFPQSNANVKDREEREEKNREEKRERESQFREFPLSATRASQDRRFYGRTSKRRSGRIPLSGSPKWPEMRGSHADSEPVPSSDRLHMRVNSKRSSSRKRFT